MSSENAAFQHPLTGRYASRRMKELFSPRRKFILWRKLWVVLAEAERELGLPITEEQVHEMRQAVEDIDFEAARRYERQTRHDVMAHLKAFADKAPAAAPVIHLGATSCYVTDNAELIQMRDGLRLIAVRLANIIDALARFARTYRDLVTLGHTHFQPAQPTTVGKRAALWLQDLLDARQAVHHGALPRFTGGAVGYAGYYIVRHYEPLPACPEDDRGLPDMAFGFYDTMVIFDHVEKTVRVVANALVDSPADASAAYADACEQIDTVCERLRRPAPFGSPKPAGPPGSPPTALHPRAAGP